MALLAKIDYCLFDVMNECEDAVSVVTPTFQEQFQPSYTQEFNQAGILVLEQFFNGYLLEEMVQEANALANQAFFETVIGNAYLKPVDSSLPADHALNTTESTTVGVVAYDQLPADSVLKAIYLNKGFHSFIEKILNKGPLYRYDCELGAINIAVMRPGDYLRWHFDQSDFVVSIPLQLADSGGIYEYIRNLKNETDPNYEAVRQAVKGESSQVARLDTPPGSLIFFEGRHTLHRVTPIEGEQVRLVALLGYADRPGVRSDPYLRRIRYGR
ncbi:MAG: hypothetical protein EPN84_12165 [Legionella sp.]|nr:MAG: hypothetical protein EPN84_12165 [Legionella sp.]